MKRRKAREFALRLLYQVDIRKDPPEEIAAAFWQGFPQVDRELKEFAETLVRGVCEHRQEIDAVIASAALNWDLDRMGYMDRNILRLATFEIRHLPGVPPIVAINEAIEIAKVYGTEDSPRFVNGILNKIKDEVCSEREPPGQPPVPEQTT